MFKKAFPLLFLPILLLLKLALLVLWGFGSFLVGGGCISTFLSLSLNVFNLLFSFSKK